MLLVDIVEHLILSGLMEFSLFKIILDLGILFDNMLFVSYLIVLLYQNIDAKGKTEDTSGTFKQSSRK